ncbi:MAG: DUF5081 family protein [Lachnospiraceae bacterium]|jgi:hypothetical protein|nr:DUF5081 family protein [Lachnospiraceae bacterium]
MYLKLIEVYVLNRALDGKDIFMLPSFSAINASELLISDVKESLIINQVLASHTSLTMEGAKIVNRMKDYKNASLYMTLDDLTIGIRDNASGIMITNIEDKYAFTVIDITDFYEQIVSVHPYIAQDYVVDEVEKVTIGFDELKTQYNVSRDMSLNVKTSSDRSNTDELIFVSNNRLYLYDMKSEILAQTNSSSIKAMITERITIDE